MTYLGIVLTCRMILFGLSESHHEIPLQRIVDEAREELNSTGLSVAVITREGEIWQEVSGELAAGRPMTTDAAFQIGSITKTYTAALTMRLVEDGAFKLDDSIARWFPNLPNAQRITPRQILNHTSGLNDIFQKEGFTIGLYMNPARKWQIEDVLQHAGEPDFEPGDGWSYSSTGYLVLTRIAELQAESSYAELLRREFFTPMGLRRTYIGGVDSVPEPVAHAYIDINNDGKPEDYSAMLPMTGFLTAFGGAGAIVATPGDVAIWLRALVRGEVVALDEMEKWVDRTDGNQHGLGLLKTTIDGVELIGHRGNSGGFSCAAWHAPQRQLTVVVCCNRNGILVTPAVSRVLKAIDESNSHN